jgi:hypothetical protein
MRVLINGQSVSGSPAEIAELLKCMSKPRYIERKPQTPRSQKPYRYEYQQPSKGRKVPYLPPPVYDAVAQSRELRQRLAEDPNYNPYGGVLTPQDQEKNIPMPGTGRMYGAEEDTGITKN